MTRFQVCYILLVTPTERENIMEALNAYQLANLADCGTPDTLESPGARFLLGVQSDVAERYQWAVDHDEDLSDLSDLAHEIADGAVPIYTHELWATFVDLAAWQEDLDELGGATADMEQNARVCLYMIAERLALALLEQAGE